MSKTLRLSEKWFNRGLWLVAFLFAWFLTGLGSTIVGDLPQMKAVSIGWHEDVQDARQEIAAAIAEETDTIETVYEPYLLQIGFLERTPRGRKATAGAYRHLGLPTPPIEPTLL